MRTVVLVGVAAILGVLNQGRMTAQERPDFSGTWTSSSGPALAIKQSGQTLTVSTGAETQAINLDGSESQTRRQGRSFDYTQTSQARWVGSALLITRTTVSPIGTWQDLDVYSLDYGNKLTVVRIWTQTTAPMMGTTTSAYTRQ